MSTWPLDVVVTYCTADAQKACISATAQCVPWAKMATVLYNTNVDCTSGFTQSPCIGLLLFLSAWKWCGVGLFWLAVVCVSFEMVWGLPIFRVAFVFVSFQNNMEIAIFFRFVVVSVSFEMICGLPFGLVCWCVCQLWKFRKWYGVAFFGLLLFLTCLFEMINCHCLGLLLFLSILTWFGCCHFVSCWCFCQLWQFWLAVVLSEFKWFWGCLFLVWWCFGQLWNFEDDMEVAFFWFAVVCVRFWNV